MFEFKEEKDLPYPLNTQRVLRERYKPSREQSHFRRSHLYTDERMIMGCSHVVVHMIDNMLETQL